MSAFACARYDHAYPYLINQDSRIGDPSGRNFQFLSCSGAVMKDVVDKQIPELDDNQDAITLSIGMFSHSFGNESRRCVLQSRLLIANVVQAAMMLV
jgi:hypothetical protein